MSSEKDIIAQYFWWGEFSANEQGLILGIGDDAAWLKIPHDKHLIISTDTCVIDSHFPANMIAHAIGWRSLAVAVSDLVGSMANPQWFLLNLTLPAINHQWLQQFSQGMRESAMQHNIKLVGGDLTRGALSISVTVLGTAPVAEAARRTSAKAGDYLAVTGQMGEAYSQMKDFLSGKSNANATAKYCYPSVHTCLIDPLQSLVSAAMDVSDGLLLDCSRMVADGLSVLLDQTLVQQCTTTKVPFQDAIRAGDDYQLLIAFDKENEATIRQICEQYKIALSIIGIFDVAKFDAEGNKLVLANREASNDQLDWLAKPWGWETFQND